MEIKAGYKQTEVGVIPEDWEVKRLGDIGESLIGLTYKPIDVKSDGILVLRSSNVKDGALRFQDNVFVDTDVPERIMVKQGDILICVRNGSRDLIGKCAKIDFQAKDMTFGAFMAVFRTPLHPFIFHQFQSNIIKKQINEHLGATINQITNKSLNSFQVPLPPTKAEQQAIAEALSDADALIASLEELIAKKRDIKQGAMQTLLTGKQRLPGFEVKPGYQQTEVGEIPVDWDMVEIGSLISDFRGGAPLKPSDFTDSGVKVLPKGGVGRSGWLKINISDLQYCSTDFASSHRNNQVDKTFTIVVLRDLVPSGPSIGLIVQIKDEDTFVLAQGVYGFKVNHLSIPSFLVHVSNTSWYRKIANSTMVGSTQVHITNTAFKKIKIPIPPTKEEQQAIATVLSDMDAEISALEAKLSKARELKQGMMQELLTGQIRLV